jgi:hypothetical protein
MSIYESNYKSLRALFGSDVQGFPSYLKFEAKGFMPLTFDRLQIQNGIVQYAMTHWYEQHGDLIQDPEMIIEFRGEFVEAISIQHPPPFNRVIPVYSEDRTRYSPVQKREQNSFLKLWLKNIRMQGFERVALKP